MTLDASVRKPGLAALVCTKEQAFVQNCKNVFHIEDRKKWMRCTLTAEAECAHGGSLAVG